MSTNQFRLTTAETDSPPIVVATGEIDLANVDQFDALLTQAAHDNPEVTVDLTNVTYCDSAALRALFAAAAVTQLTLVVPSRGPLTTLLGISGLDRVARVNVVD